MKVSQTWTLEDTDRKEHFTYYVCGKPPYYILSIHFKVKKSVLCAEKQKNNQSVLCDISKDLLTKLWLERTCNLLDTFLFTINVWISWHKFRKILECWFTPIHSDFVVHLCGSFTFVQNIDTTGICFRKHWSHQNESNENEKLLEIHFLMLVV